MQKQWLKYLLGLFVSICVAGNAGAQVFPLSGSVYDSSRIYVVPGVQVICTCGTMDFTDSTGRYTVFVSDADSVFFFFRDRPTQKFAVKNAKDFNNFDIALNIVLPGRYRQLPEVIVYGNRYKQDSIENRLNYDKIFQFQKPGISIAPVNNAMPGAAVGVDLENLINMFRFRRNRSMLRFQQRLIREEQDRYIDYRFNKKIVKQLTGIDSDIVLDQYLKEYRPEYELLTQVIDIELYQYIQLSMKAFISGGKLP